MVTDCQSVTIFSVRYSKAGVLVLQRSIDGVVCFFGRLSIALCNDILSIFCICFRGLQTIMRFALYLNSEFCGGEARSADDGREKKLPVTRSHEFCAAGI